LLSLPGDYPGSRRDGSRRLQLLCRRWKKHEARSVQRSLGQGGSRETERLKRVRSSLVPHFINTATFATRDFWPSRGASDAHTLRGLLRSEQRRRGQKEPSPGGLPRFSVLASLLLGHSPTSGDAPSSRLARTENRRNKRGRIYETGYLAGQKIIVIRAAVGYRSLHKPTQKNHD